MQSTTANRMMISRSMLFSHWPAKPKKNSAAVTRIVERSPATA